MLDPCYNTQMTSKLLVFVKIPPFFPAIFPFVPVYVSVVKWDKPGGRCFKVKVEAQRSSVPADINILGICALSGLFFYKIKFKNLPCAS